MKEKLNVLSLFDGISCGQLALNRAGIKYDKYFASEIDKSAIQVTQHNYPNTVQLGSVVDVKVKDLPKIDLLLGGFCCQSFSFSGKQLNFDDPRGKLFFEYVRLLKELEPKYFLAENVRMKKEYQDIISEHLGVEPIGINSCLVSAQNRNRLYWTNIPNITQPEDKKIHLKYIIQQEYDGIWVYPRGENPGGVQSYKGKSPTVTISSWQHNFLIYKSDIPNFKSDVKVNRPIGQYRKFTPIEVERLQTVPENYTSILSDTQRYKCLGNGWTVDVIAHILKNIV